MKTGMGLIDLAHELERQAKERKDYISPSSKITMEMRDPEVVSAAANLEKVLENVEVPETEVPANVLGRILGKVNVDEMNGTEKEIVRVPHLTLDGKHMFQIGRIAHEQLSGKLTIPRRYYDRMLTEAPELLMDNVNHWLHDSISRRMIRTLDGRARAFLSDRYRPLDSAELLGAVLPTLQETDCKVVSCDLTERRMYLKVVSERIRGNVKVGDVVQAGLVLSNSEVGCGSVRVEPLVFRLSCLNGMIMADKAMKKYHIGRTFGSSDENIFEMLRDETRAADDRAFFMKVQDVVRGTLTQDLFDMELKKIITASNREIELPLQDVVENVGKTYSLTEGETGDLLKLLVKGGDLTQWGMGNALTLQSQSVDSYERATEMERIGGQVVELAARNWQAIAA